MTEIPIDPATGAIDAKPGAILLLRLGGAVAASVAFGLIAAASLAPWNFWVAVGLGFLFGTAFIGGTGYRIVIGVVRQSMEPAPASWSGATAGSALYAAVLFAIVTLWGRDGAYVVLAYGVAIAIAYLPVKLACLRVGCCTVGHGHRTPGDVDLRLLEVALTVGVLVVAGGLAPMSVDFAGIVAVAGHLGVRLLSRRMRNRWSWGWPPLAQPGAEIAPLALVLVLGMSVAF